MPKQYFEVSPVVGDTDGRVSADAVNAVVAELNTRMRDIADGLAQVQGLDGYKPTFFGDADFGGKRICNVGSTVNDDDVAPRSELVDRALYSIDGEKHIATRPFVARGGLRASLPASDPDDVLTLGQAESQFTAKSHSLLDPADHTDTAAGVVVRGSLIKGDTTPAWGAFPIGAALEFIRVNAAGTDLEYVAGALAGDHIDVTQEALSGSGTTFELKYTPITDSLVVTFNAQRMRRIAKARQFHEDLSPQGAGTSFTLTYTPEVGTEVLTLNTIRLRRVTAAPSTNEYTISGTAVTLGVATVSGDVLLADYSAPAANEFYLVGRRIFLGMSVGGSDVVFADYRVLPGSVRIHDENMPGVGTVFTAASTITAGTEVVTLNTLRLVRVASGPGLNEYTISGSTITLGVATVAGDVLLIDYDTTVAAVAHTHTYHEALTGTGTAFSLAATPIVGSDALWFNTLRLVRVAAGPGLGEYTITGAAITLGFTKGASDVLVADYTT